MDDAPKPEPKSGYAAMLAEILGILADAVMVAVVIVAIFGLDTLSYILFPPDGPVAFHHTRFEFPFQ